MAARCECQARPDPDFQSGPPPPPPKVMPGRTLDDRNVELCRERVGMFLEVVEMEGSQ